MTRLPRPQSPIHLPAAAEDYPVTEQVDPCGMTSATSRKASETAAVQALAPATHPCADPLLDHLRHVARTTRCKGYVDMFGACAALSGNRQVAAQSASDVLMRCLGQALGRRPILLREGEPEISFDEAWLMTLAHSLRQSDTSSATFLLRSRVPVHARRYLVFLLRMVVDKYAQV